VILCEDTQNKKNLKKELKIQGLGFCDGEDSLNASIKYIIPICKMIDITKIQAGAG